jgi:TatD DNase family protein
LIPKSLFSTLFHSDIGANLCDTMYSGEYNGKTKHPGDIDAVLERAEKCGLEKIIITSGDLKTLQQASELIQSYKTSGKFQEMLYTTCGVHPTMAGEFEKESAASTQYFDQLLNAGLQYKDHIVAVGEFGLDYDRLQFCDKETQLKYFEKQFVLAETLQVPLFLHMRECASDFIDVVTRNRHRFTTGVVHSFTGTTAEAKQMINLGLYIGINGCSLKTEENLEVVKSIPIDRIMIETDAPWCEIRPTHAGFKYVKTSFDSIKREKWSNALCVKGRNEPCYLVNILEVIAGVKGIDVQILAEIIFYTTANVFFPHHVWPRRELKH